jgi:cell division septation protein DedD
LSTAEQKGHEVTVKRNDTPTAASSGRDFAVSAAGSARPPIDAADVHAEALRRLGPKAHTEFEEAVRAEMDRITNRLSPDELRAKAEQLREELRARLDARRS